MRMMWNEEVGEITDRNKPLTAEEVPAARKVADSRRYMLRGPIKWLFHGRTVNLRYTATDRFYLMRWQDVAEKYCQAMEANESKGRWSQEKLIVAQLKVRYLPHFSVERRQRDYVYRREDGFRFSNQIWQNKPWWYHVAWTLTAARCFWCTIAFSQWSCSPGSRSDGNVLTSHHGKAIQTILPPPIEKVSPLETSERL